MAARARVVPSSIMAAALQCSLRRRLKRPASSEKVKSEPAPKRTTQSANVRAERAAGSSPHHSLSVMSKAGSRAPPGSAMSRHAAALMVAEVRAL